MNKKLSTVFKLLCFTFCVTLCLVILSGCSKNVDITCYMSDVREILYAGEDDKVFVTVVSGSRENPYKYDGIKNENVDFCIVSLFPTGAKVDGNVLDVELLVGDITHDITLEKSPYENAYMADIGNRIGVGQTLKLECADLGVALELCNESQKWEIKSDDAIRIGSDELAEKIQAKIENNTLLGECYLKIIYDKSRSIKTYYWYFTFVSTDGSSSSCVIDTTTGKVLAKI
ncbi:MAG: hypothetical protein ACI4T2_02205 [Christensenellales bacterium]